MNDDSSQSLGLSCGESGNQRVLDLRRSLAERRPILRLL